MEGGTSPSASCSAKSAPTSRLGEPPRSGRQPPPRLRGSVKSSKNSKDRPWICHCFIWEKVGTCCFLVFILWRSLTILVNLFRPRHLSTRRVWCWTRRWDWVWIWSSHSHQSLVSWCWCCVLHVWLIHWWLYLNALCFSSNISLKSFSLHVVRPQCEHYLWHHVHDVRGSPDSPPVAVAHRPYGRHRWGQHSSPVAVCVLPMRTVFVVKKIIAFAWKSFMTPTLTYNLTLF